MIPFPFQAGQLGYESARDPFAGLTEVIHMDFDAGNGSTTFTDSGSAGTTWTRASTETCTTSTILDGVSSLQIVSGGASRLTATTTSANRLPATGNFRLKFLARSSNWLKADTTGSSILSLQDSSATAAGTQFVIAVNSSSVPLLVYSDGTTRTVATGSGGGLATAATLDFEFARDGTTLTLKIAGTTRVTVTGFSGSFPAITTTPWVIGNNGGFASSAASGILFDKFTLER